MLMPCDLVHLIYDLPGGREGDSARVRAALRQSRKYVYLADNLCWLSTIAGPNSEALHVSGLPVLGRSGGCMGRI